MKFTDMLNILRMELIPALGCTEPAAAALAGAKAREVLGVDEISHAIITASHDMVKNTMGVAIPKCKIKGIVGAVSLGIAGGQSDKNLSVLSFVTPEDIAKAEKMNVKLEVAKKVPSLYVSVQVFSADGRQAVVTISEEHERFSHIEKDGTVLLDIPLGEVEEEDESQEENEEKNGLANITLDEILKFVELITKRDVPFIDNAIKTNLKICFQGTMESYGLNVGKIMFPEVPEPRTLDDAFRLASCYAASGSDARMSGCSLPVIINSGSGNQGMVVTVPVKIVADFLQVPEIKLLKAVCISEIVALALTARKTRLSALCGAFTASIGTACAYCYLLDGGVDAMNRAICNMIANLTGIICDGAKTTCALKIFSCLEAAALSVKLAMKGVSPDEDNGIIGRDALESIEHLFRISSEGMEETDKTIFSIMIDKKC